MDNTSGLNDLLSTVLGSSTPSTKHNLAYNCPFCNHHKPKLIVNTDVLHWHCWVCGAGGKSLFTLFKKLNVAKDKFNRLRELVGSWSNTTTTELTTIVELPRGTKPLWIPNKNSPEYKNALRYVLSRSISLHDILRHKIMYCDEGQYAGKIIIPSYNTNGTINYFASRGYYEADESKHKNPSISKDIIGFELFINWDEPLVLVEGPFDAIAIRRNAIPLFGKFISNKLRLKIINSGVKDIYLCLDNDAIKQSIETATEFIAAGINVYIVNLQDKDPSIIGFNKMMELIKNTDPITESQLFSKQLESRIKF